MRALWVTIRLVFISIMLGALLSVPLAYARMSSNRLLRRACLRLCLLLPRHAAAGADISCLLWPGLVPASARGRRVVVVLPRRVVLRYFRIHAQHRRLPGRDFARRDRKRAARPMGRRGVARPAQVPDAAQGHPAASADRGAPPLRQRDHPDDQGFRDCRYDHGLRPDGRNATRLFTQLRLPDLYLGRVDLSHHRRGRYGISWTGSSASSPATLFADAGESRSGRCSLPAEHYGEKYGKRCISRSRRHGFPHGRPSEEQGRP